MNRLNVYFGFDRHRTSLSCEVIAGLTTFTTMSYIVVINPAILSTAGIPQGASFVATVLVAVAGCYLMAFYANRPFAIAPHNPSTLHSPPIGTKWVSGQERPAP